MAMRTLTVVLEPDTASGGFTVHVPAWLGCISHGKTVEEALTNIAEVALLWGEIVIEDGEQLPNDDPNPDLLHCEHGS